MIVAGDIGGTKTVLGLFDKQNDLVHLVRQGTYSSPSHRSLEEILAEFLKQLPGPLRGGCFGVAGPILDGHCRTTNLPWELDERMLAAAIGAPRVKLLNDLEATAYGMLVLKPEELSVLNPGAQPARQGHVAVIAAGTGLGEGMLYWDGARHHPMASEGGHADFAPQNEEEVELLRYLWNKQGGHVSYERVLSGPGLYNVYSFLRERNHYQEPDWLAKMLKTADPSAVVSQLGLEGKDPLCESALEMFAVMYGSETGNLALKCLAVGGVYVAGGIAPKILPALQKNGNFLHGYLNKGRFRDLLEDIPVRVALNPLAPLLGAAHYAATLEGSAG